jgi:hypothetical protein
MQPVGATPEKSERGPAFDKEQAMKSVAMIGAMAAALLGVGAMAQEPAPPPPDYVPTPAPNPLVPSPEVDPSAPTIYTGIGMTAEIGGGVGGFLDSRAAAQTTESGLWNARLTVGSRAHFGGELAYIGSAQTIEALGTATDAHLIGGGIEGDFRFNFLTGMWQPYAVAGVGWQHYAVVNTAVNTSDFENTQNAVEFPLGAGIAWRYKGFVADARLAFHPSAGSNLPSGINLSTWDLGGRLGFEF